MIKFLLKQPRFVYILEFVFGAYIVIELAFQSQLERITDLIQSEVENEKNSKKNWVLLAFDAFNHTCFTYFGFVFPFCNNKKKLCIL